jgi:phage terminase large subunit GpA-like protein
MEEIAIKNAIPVNDVKWRCPHCGRYVSPSFGECRVCFQPLKFEADEFVIVNFHKQPILLEQFINYSESKEITLSKVIVGFAAKGYKEILENEKVNLITRKYIREKHE